MKRTTLSALALLAVAMPAAAQAGTPVPAPRGGADVSTNRRVMIYNNDGDGMMMPGGPGNVMFMRHDGPGAASMLLSHTGELKLTDQQVVRLAAIARRAQERHEAMHQGMMAEHANAQPGQPAPPSGDMMRRMQAQMEQMHEQERADLRDALAVLTPDQLATAFEMAHEHGGMPGMMPSMQTRTIRIDRDGDGPVHMRTEAPRPPS
jgi:hypothetical protein